MRRIYPTLLLLSLFCMIDAFGQLSNAGFENWDDSGKPAPFDWKQPTGWTSTNSLTEWTAANVKPYQPAVSGDYSVQLKSVPISGGWYTAICNGTPNLISDFSAPGIDIITGGEPINYKPEKLMGTYNYLADPSDRGYGVVILKKYNTALQKHDTIGWGDIYFQPSLVQQSFEIDITYQATPTLPDSIVIAFYSTDPENPKAMSNTDVGLLLDDLSLSAPVSVCDCLEETEEVTLYPNPAKDQLTVQYPSDWERVNADLYSITGRWVKRYAQVNRTLNVEYLPEGIYVLRLNSEQGTVAQKLIISRD